MLLINVDGSVLEGGGQILRNASALAAITGVGICVEKIRAGRPKPGLRPQHLTGLRLIERICGGDCLSSDAAVGTTRVELRPHRLLAGHYEADTHTAGSCTLMVQQALPCLLFARQGRPAANLPESWKRGLELGGQSGSAAGRVDASSDSGSDGLDCPIFSTLMLRGGTDADMAPPVDYLTEVLVPTLNRIFKLPGLEVAGVRRGFMPKGGGLVTARVQALAVGESLPGFDLSKRGEVVRVRISAFSAGRVTPDTASRMVREAELRIRGLLGAEVTISSSIVRETAETAFGEGCGCCVVAETSTGCILGATGPGRRNVSAEQVAAAAVEELHQALAQGACVDHWMQDQLIIFMGLAAGESKMLCSEPTMHTRTAMLIVEQLLPGVAFDVSAVQGPQEEDKLWLIRCRNGSGHKA